MKPSLDETFDATIILGMHAMEGTRDGVMNSTLTTREAVKNYKKVSLFIPVSPVELRVEYSGNTRLVDCVAQVPGVVRINGSTISYTSATVSEGLRALTHLASWMLGEHP